MLTRRAKRSKRTPNASLILPPKVHPPVEVDLSGVFVANLNFLLVAGR